MVKVSLSDLLISIDGRPLLKIDHISIGSGQSVWLRGANGVGKTTLLKTLAGLRKPDRGSRQVDGASGPWWRLRIGAGQIVYLHQTPYLFDGSVQQNLAYSLSLQSLSKEEQQRRIGQALEIAELTHLIDRPAQVLSGGERQRLALARAWVVRPEILMLDEPTANLDDHSIKVVAKMVTQLQQQGCGILVTSHQTTEVTKLCRQRWQLHNGHLLQSVSEEPTACQQ
ncbi:tungstate transport system ATP-binding protein [Ferrimonas sediminum]|uniref:Tungstate transport system ATP-binding protein n=1 Tax=Ferrimonas sediminum TaxID=718193 RepID=A0A1G8JHK0_9GAMM|nr:energy-coupling factor ABC transporter ATP-binding protein [Ferrimonas sediminum]SDI30110.1 tungstate transport system ATP-binding protein [Ferrimonas sediminum]